MRRDFIIKKILMTMAITLLTIMWVFLLDGIEDGEWNNLRIAGSIFLFLALYSAAEIMISYKIQYNFLLQKIVLLLVFVVLFGIIGKLFYWNMPKDVMGMIKAFVTIVPVYVIWYLMDLKSSRKFAADINKIIQDRNENHEDL